MRRKVEYFDQESNLSADEKNSQENSRDSQPLPTRNVFLEKDRRKPDGDRSVQRTKNANHGNLLHLHSEIAEHKRTGIKKTHPAHHPAHVAARQLHGLLRNQHHSRNE